MSRQVIISPTGNIKGYLFSVNQHTSSKQIETIRVNKLYSSVIKKRTIIQ